MKTESNLTKSFGKSGISREYFERLPYYPICTDGVTDEQMQELADSVEAEVRDRYPEIADKMFEIWKKEEERTNEELDFLFYECFRANELWCLLTKQYALEKIGMKYYKEK